MREDPLQPEQLLLGSPIDDLVVAEQAVPDNTVQVSPANPVLNDDVTVYPFAGGNTGAFGPLSFGQASRWDLVALNLTTTPATLQVVVGTPFATPQPYQNSLPAIPAGRIPLAAVHITEVTPSPVIITSADITGIRSLYHGIQRTKLATGGTPADVDPSTGALGSSTDAAKADHVHKHGDLSGVATTHHDGLQTKYTPTTPADWSPATTEARTSFDQLASRVKTLETAPSGSGALYEATVASSGGDFTTLSAAIAAYEAGTERKGLIRIRGSVTAMSGPQTLTKPGLEVEGETDDATLSFNGSPLTVNTGITNEKVPIKFSNVKMIMSSTGRILFSGSAYLRLADIEIQGNLDEKFRFAGDDNVVILERVFNNTSSGMLFGFDDTLVSGTLEAWFSACVGRRGGSLVRADTPAGGADLEFHFMNRTMMPSMSLDGTGQQVDIHYDGTSLFYDTWFPALVRNVYGTAYLDEGMIDRYAALTSDTTTSILPQGVKYIIERGGKDFLIGPGTISMASSAINIATGQDNFTVRGSGKGSTIVQMTGGSNVINFFDNTHVTIKDMTLESTSVSANITFVEGDGDYAAVHDIHCKSALTGDSTGDYVDVEHCHFSYVYNVTSEIGASGAVAYGVKIGYSGHVSKCDLYRCKNGGIQANVANAGTTIDSCFVTMKDATGIGINIGGPEARVSDCRVQFLSTGVGGGRGIYASLTADRSTITNCYVNGNTHADHGIDIGGNATQVTVMGCLVQSFKANGIRLGAGATQPKIIGNEVQGTSVTGYGIDGNVNGCTLMGNLVALSSGGALAGIRFGDSAAVSGNFVNGCTVGLQVPTGSVGACTITGNRVFGCSSHGIEIIGTGGDNAVTGNVIRTVGGDGIKGASVPYTVYNSNVVFNATGTDYNVTGTGIVNTDNIGH
jgi:hypothetical protein